MADDLRLDLRALEDAAAGVLAALGSSPAEARAVAEHLAGADAAGHPSHGTGLLPTYAKHVRAGLVAPNAKLATVQDAGAILQFDADGGYGAPAGRAAVDAAAARSGETGVCAVTLGNVHHLGRIGGFGERAAAAGRVFVGFVNVTDHAALVAPYRGADARFGTNPVCVAFPATEATPPFLLDMATSRIALGKARVAATKGEKVPFGSVLDDAGRPTDDPTGMGSHDYSSHRGALAFLGEHKGYGLGYACELLAGVLSGFGTIQPGNARRDGLQNRLFAIVLDPSRFAEPDWVAREVDALRAWVTASPPADAQAPVLVPGDPERAARAAGGVVLDAAVADQIDTLAAELKVAPIARG